MVCTEGSGGSIGGRTVTLAKIRKALRNFFQKRGLVLTLVFAAFAVVLIGRLVDLQLVHGSEYSNDFSVLTTAERTLKATRGRIYDCNGELLAYNQLAENITIEDNGSYDSTREKNLELNGEIYRLTQMIRDNGDSLSHDFHIVVNNRGNFAFDTDDETTLARFRADVYGYQTVDELSDEEASASAQEIMDELMSSDRFGLVDEEEPYTEEEKSSAGLPDELTNEEALDIVIVRYQLSLVSYQRYVAVTVATNVSEETVAAVQENADTLQGVSVSEDYIRVYDDSEAMGPLLGYTGKPSTSELADLQETSDNYTSDSIIGKAGIEQSMETTLQGTNGSETVTIDNLGTVISVDEDSVNEPEQGNDVYLTIDKDLQEKCYQILEQRIAGIVLLNLVDAKEIDKSSLSDADEISIPSYDCYNAIIGNNMVDYTAFDDDDASDNEKALYSAYTSKQDEVLNWVNEQLTTDSPTAYSSLNEEQQAYFDYIIETFLTDTYGILDENEIDESDETYTAYMDDGSISPQEFLRYAANNNWIDVSKINDENNDYMTSSEVYDAVCQYIQDELPYEDDFAKLLYKRMLLNDEISPRQVMLTLYDQGVLSTDDGIYEGLESGSTSAYDAMYSLIQSLEITPAMLALDPCSGSMVVTDPDTGAVKACVTYPGYDSNRLANDMDTDYYNKLNTDQSTPFYNKASQQLTAPGSTFKLCMATAGLDTGVITTDTTINCTGIFDTDLVYLSDSDKVHCWIYPQAHGSLNVVGGIQNSCNVFFCTVGLMLGLDSDNNFSEEQALALEQKYAAMYGLNETSGVQLNESEPHVSDEMPFPSAIGQGTHQYTTTQLARYVSAIANGGDCYYLTLVDKTTDPDGNQIDKYEKIEGTTVDVSDDIFDTLREGMFAAVNSDTVWSGFSNEIYVYGKTGTAQESTTRPDHALAVGFTEVQDGADTSVSEKGNIAYACRIAEGYSSRNASLCARDMLNIYYGLTDESEILTGQANMTDMVATNVTD
jgi:penicillin-binding protein 2